MSLTRVQSSLELLCQTAGALEANDVVAARESREVGMVSPNNLVGYRAAQSESPLYEEPVIQSGRSTSHQYLVGSSPSHDSFVSGFEDEEDVVSAPVPSHRPTWPLNHSGQSFNVRENYVESLQSNGLMHSRTQPPFAPNQSSSFRPPTTRPGSWMVSAEYPPTGKDQSVIYRPIVSYDAHSTISKTESSLTLHPSSQSGNTTPPASDLIAENAHLRQEVLARDKRIAALLDQVEDLQAQVSSLKSLPVGKISQIPVDDLLEIMHEYGSEVSEHALPPRKGDVQKASVVRQFRRWNPNFFEYFEHRHGKWVPKLGKKAELERRDRNRLAHQKSMPQKNKGNRTKCGKRRS